MKNYYLLLLLFLGHFGKAQIITIPDANFKAKLLATSSTNYLAHDVYGNSIQIDSNGNGEIEVLEASIVSRLDVSSFDPVTSSIGPNPISSLIGIDYFVNLKELTCKHNTLTFLQLDLPNLFYLDCSHNAITSLQLNLSNLNHLDCSNNAITSLQLNLPNLDSLECSYNAITLLQLNLPDLNSLRCSYNAISSFQLDLPNLFYLDCSHNIITSFQLDLPNLTTLECSYNNITNLSVSNPLILQTLFYESNQLPNLNLSQFPNLTGVNCGYNQITSLDSGQFPNLTVLLCNGNQIASLDVSNLINLTHLSCNNNVLINLDLSSNQYLQKIYCSHNQLISILLPDNIVGDIYITNPTLDCSNNLLTNLIIPKITTLKCYNNLLTDISFLYPELMNRMDCRNNNFTSLDFSNLTKHTISQINVSGNSNLTYLSIKNGKYNIYEGLVPSSLNGLFFDDCPNLQFLCVDDLPNEIAYIQSKIEEYGYTNCNLNSYCSFTPGGTFYTIQGENKFDNENNGCDSADGFIPSIKYSITDGTITGSLISNNSGSYSTPVVAGIHTITPVFENPSYFNVTPSNIVLDFPIQTSPVTQDFCISPNGVIHDVEVSIIPTTVARPGFDCKYQIVYKNKGNQVENGTLNLAFDDSIFDFVSSSVATSSQNFGNLNWNYSNLQPLETRTINVVLNLNSPMETPAVNADDILNLIATITSPDEVPCNNWLQSQCDNVFTLNQTVVNSFDPNDKMCLQGNFISPDRVGGFVHYIIRFENTGTFPAENIVVKDMIDTAKFDISSLVPLHASHNYFTKITGNKVEFIFENINLPFDDANNDGYVAFKIKTLPTLVLGDTFSNSANIYFDYNFPIITNTATTTIAALSNPSFEFATYFSLYPNPTTNELNINLKSAIEIHSIQIYNAIGQLVTVQTGNALKIDVSNLKTGNYFIKINTNEGFSTSQFIKE